MKLSDYKDDEALELVADLIEPVTAICQDTEVVSAFGRSKPAAIKALLKGHKREVMAILAALDGVPVEEYHCNVMTLPAKIIEILNDEDLANLFTYAGQKEGGKSSGSASANTKA